MESVDGLILIEVDDLAIGTKRLQEAEFQQRFQAAFSFGKWEKREASYAGRRIRQRDQYVLVDQEKYILEKLHPILLQEKQQKRKRPTKSSVGLQPGNKSRRHRATTVPCT